MVVSSHHIRTRCAPERRHNLEVGTVLWLEWGECYPSTYASSKHMSYKTVYTFWGVIALFITFVVDHSWMFVRTKFDQTWPIQKFWPLKWKDVKPHSKMTAIKEQVKELTENQKHILEAIKYLKERMEYMLKKFDDEKTEDVNDILKKVIQWLTHSLWKIPMILFW